VRVGTGLFASSIRATRWIVQLIGATTTKNGLSVACRIGENLYPKGVTGSDDDIKAINITCDKFHDEWNYTI
jgi:hypothetical protein